ncbi:SHOCT domain-containing protein [Halorubrum vacuolatum]|uniref:Short C-terminal domain-containing protein n=1 Tax=Halorubrum vacuolatum TaxID=63740 RepID=A0A238VAG5_HALVU|nr:SHOCT domain-containing protein [Halorubrum vacuolatum]SNR31422.1 Short C-terminal domain-containing protein [Halorubrum vacuolatum]
MSSLPTFEKKRLIGLLGVLSFGLTSLFAVLGFNALVPVTFVIGFFILIPLVLVLGEDFPLVESTAEGTEAAEKDPVATLRRRYATGEIDEREFERRLDRLLETEELSGDRSTTERNRHTDETDRMRHTDETGREYEFE